MLGYLHPDNIYDDFKANKLTKQEAIDLLFSLRSKISSSYFQVRSLEILDNIKVELPKIVKYASTLVNDKFPKVRIRALKLVLKNSPETALVLLNSLIPKEDSVYVLRSIYRALKNSKEKQFKRLILKIIEKIADFHGVVFEEGKFILDLYIASNSDEIISLHLDKEYKEFYISNYLSDLFYIFCRSGDWITRFIIKNSHIIFLDCTLMELNKLPESIELLSRLRYLKLTANNINDIPKAISKLCRLKYLDLSGNNIKNIPKIFSKLCWLEYLNLSGNKFSSLPYVLSKLKFIKQFYFVSNCELKFLPNWIIQFSNRIFARKYVKQGVSPNEAPILGIFEILLGYHLEKIDLEECTYGEGGYFYKINKIGNVIGIYIHGDYPDNPVLQHIPEQISKLKFLEELYLPSNTIRKIPKSIKKLSVLKYLNLSFNEISEVKNLKLPVNLRKLDLKYNKISSTKGLKDLRNLIEIHLDANPISNWRGLTNLNNLQKFSFSGRYVKKSWRGIKRISEISGLSRLKNLEQLNLSCNNIMEIESLENLLCLKKLSLRNNQINEIKGLENLINLKYLNLDGNPISGDLIKILGGYEIMGGQKVIKYPQKLVNYCRRMNNAKFRA